MACVVAYVMGDAHVMGEWRALLPFIGGWSRRRPCFDRFVMEDAHVVGGWHACVEVCACVFKIDVAWWMCSRNLCVWWWWWWWCVCMF